MLVGHARRLQLFCHVHNSEGSARVVGMLVQSKSEDFISLWMLQVAISQNVPRTMRSVAIGYLENPGSFTSIIPAALHQFGRHGDCRLDLWSENVDASFGCKVSDCSPVLDPIRHAQEFLSLLLSGCLKSWDCESTRARTSVYTTKTATESSLYTVRRSQHGNSLL